MAIDRPLDGTADTAERQTCLAPDQAESRLETCLPPAGPVGTPPRQAARSPGRHRVVPGPGTPDTGPGTRLWRANVKSPRTRTVAT